MGYKKDRYYVRVMTTVALLLLIAAAAMNDNNWPLRIVIGLGILSLLLVIGALVIDEGTRRQKDREMFETHRRIS